MTRRALGLLLGAIGVVALGASVGGLATAGLVLLCAVALAILVDARSAPGPARVRVQRDHDRILSIGVSNTIVLKVSAPDSAVLTIRDDAPAAVASSPLQHTAHGPAELAYTVTPRARGNARFGRVSVRSLGPWGLGFRQFQVADPTPVRVDANVAAVRVYEALARRGRLEELGVRSLHRHGEGTEFERVRDAVPDDPLRSINWRASARTGRLMATELASERAQPVIVCLDHGRLMGVGAGTLTKLDHAINAALLLWHVALSTGDRAGLIGFADGITTTIEPRAGTAQLNRLLDALGDLRAQEIEPDYGVALSQLRQRQKRRALLAIFTDLVDPDQAVSLVSQCALLRRRHLPLVITVRDPAVDDVARRRPMDSQDVYARSVADGITAARDAALRLLRTSRVDVIDADARELSPRVVNRYLELKRRAAL